MHNKDGELDVCGSAVHSGGRRQPPILISTHQAGDKVNASIAPRINLGRAETRFPPAAVQPRVHSTRRAHQADAGMRRCLRARCKRSCIRQAPANH